LILQVNPRLHETFMNNPDLLEAAPARPRRHRRLLGCGAVLLVLFVACGGFYGFLMYSSDKETRDAIAELDQKEPDGWTLDAIEAHRKEVSDDENAALVVQALKGKLPRPWPTPRPAPPGDRVPGEPALPLPGGEAVYVDNDLSDLPPEVQLDAFLLQDLRAQLEKAEPARGEGRKLAGLNWGRFPIYYTKDSISTLIPSQDARTAANLLRYEAVLLAQEDKPDEALAATRGILVTARAVGDEPFLISQLIRIACTAIAVQTLERVLAQGEPSPAELKKMQELLEADVSEPLMLYAARGERATTHQFMQALKSGDAKLSQATGTLGSSNLLEDMAGSTLARGSHARFLRILTEFVEASRLPAEQQAEPMQALEARVKKASVEYDVLIALLMPAVIKVAEAYRRDQAYLRCALVAVAAERYRRDKGAWPATPAELVDKYLKSLPVDAYDGKPLRYRILPDGVIVYSVGPDKEDNGGARNRHNPLAKGADLGFRLWNVDRRRQPPAEVLPPPAEGPEP